MTAIPIHPTGGPIHGWFSLSYSNYAVLSRTLMQSMPIEWQERMVACLNEIHEAFQHVPQPEGYEVHAATGHELMDLTDEQRAALGYSEDWYDDEEPTGLDPAALAEWQADHELPDGPVYHDPNGQEVDPSHFVQLRCEDPVPHYNRGRTYIEPAAEYLAERASATADAPPRPSPGHSAVYIDQHSQGVWSDYPTVPPGDDVLPMVWASEQAQSREDLADRGVELRVVGWIK